MSVTACNIVSASSTEDQNGYTTYIVKRQVITARGDGPKTVRDYPGVPTDTSFYSLAPEGTETDNTAWRRAQNIALASEDETLRKWFVTTTFSNDPGTQQKKDPEEEPGFPWDDPPQISTHAIKDKEPFLFDRDGLLIASSAGEPFDPVQERDNTKYILRISGFKLDVFPAFNASYRDAINSDPFFGCDPYTVKVETPGAIEKLWYAGLKPYYQETWEFAIQDETWQLRLYDYGMYKKVGTGAAAKLVALKDAAGNQLQSPRLLDGLGNVLPIGGTPVFINPGLPGVGKSQFSRYPEKAFAPLGLPQQF